MLRISKYGSRFFFEPDNGANGSGGSSQQNEGQQNGASNQGQEGNQGQQILDPFKDIDLDALDDATRAQVLQAKAQFATVANQATQARQFQSKYDQTQAQLAQIQEQIKRNAPTPPPTKAATFEDEMVEVYMQSGIEEKTARQFAKMNAPIFDKFGARFGQSMQQHLSPVINHVVNDTAGNAFNYVMQNDRLGIQNIPEVQQKLWERTQQMAANGEMVNEKVAQNLARIFWAEHMEANPNLQQQQSTPQFQPQLNQVPVFQIPNQQQQQGTRFTYPGAQGNHLQSLQNTRTRNEPVDPDTQTALAATFEGWQVKPKNFKK